MDRCVAFHLLNVRQSASLLFALSIFEERSIVRPVKKRPCDLSLLKAVFEASWASFGSLAGYFDSTFNSL